MDDTASLIENRTWTKRGSMALAAGAVCAASLAIGCGGSQTRDLAPESLAMTSETTAFYDDNETKLFEVQFPVNLPIEKPTDAESAALGGKVGPFSHRPWVTADQVQVQLSWTLANLDDAPHNVEVLIDPWNEFGRYVPGVVIVGENAVPNLSGFDETYDLPALHGDRSSRLEHTISFDQMKEVAVDFATVINILTTVKPMAAPAGTDGEPTDPRVGLVNHAFNVQNRSGSSPLTDRYIPSTIPALVGFNLGLRTRESANIAIEFVLELIDEDGNKVVLEDSHDATLVAPKHAYALPAGAGG